MVRLSKALLALAFALIGQAVNAEDRPRYAFAAKPEDAKYAEEKFAKQLKLADSITPTFIGQCENKLRFLDGDTSGRFVEILSEKPVSYNIEREIRIKKYSLAEQMNSGIFEEIDVFYNFYPSDNGTKSIYRVSEQEVLPSPGQGSNETDKVSKIQWSKWYDARFSRNSFNTDSNIVGADIFWINIVIAKEGLIYITVPKIADRPGMKKLEQRLLGILNKELAVARGAVKDIEFQLAPLDCGDNLERETDGVSFMKEGGFTIIPAPQP